MFVSTATAHRFVATRSSSQLLLDLAVAAVAFVGTMSQLAHGGIIPTRPGSAGLDLIGVVLAVCSTAPLLAWRRFPLGVFVLTASAGVLLAGLGYPVQMLLGPAAALYLFAASRPRETPWARSTTAVVVGLFLAYLGAAAAGQRAVPGPELLHTGMAWAVAWFGGERSRLRREHMADLKGRADRLERDAERERLLAVAEERARIARDLHDSAGHAINVIAVRAGAARLRHREDPDRSLHALEAIEEVARQTAEEIDHLVGALREAGPANGVEPPTGLASLNTLIARHAAAGLRVSVDTSGAPRPLGVAADQAAYRILQEALTNASRHGLGTARIEVAYDATAIELTVTNPLPPGGSPPSGRGHGLIGMRERAAVLGGTLDANRADGLFHVRARIPYGGHGS